MDKLKIIKALEYYQQQDLDNALLVLLSIKSDRQFQKKAQLEIEVRDLSARDTPKRDRIKVSDINAVHHWVDLACDRLRKEMGLDEIAFVPVETCLNTALSLLE